MLGQAAVLHLEPGLIGRLRVEVYWKFIRSRLGTRGALEAGVAVFRQRRGVVPIECIGIRTVAVGIRIVVGRPTVVDEPTTRGERSSSFPRREFLLFCVMLRRRRSGVVLRGYRRGGEPREWVILEGSVVVVRTRVVVGVHGLVHDDDLVVDRRDLLAVSLAPSPSSRVHRGPDDAQSRSAAGVVVRGLVLVHGLGDDVIGLERRVGDVPERTVVTR